MDYLLGALNDLEAEAVRSRLESDPGYRRELDRTRGNLRRLQRLGGAAAPPPRLAKRTCDFLFDPDRPRRTVFRLRKMPSLPPAQSGTRWNWADVIVTGVILLIAGLLVLPAVNSSRFQARVTACQDNLRQVGQALTEYSHKNHDVFPAVPAEGNLAAAGVYAPILTENGYLTESAAVLCPDSVQAQERGFRVPSLEELRSAVGQKLARIQRRMGGSFGYCLGYFDHGTYQPTRNLNRDYFAILADAPSDDRADHQSANHGGVGQNVLFEDLHIEFCSTSRPGKGLDDIYTNDDHEVAPGLHRDDAVVASSGTAPVVYISIP